MASPILGPGSFNPQVNFQQARESQLLQEMQNASGPDQKEKIQKAAREFEALLLTSWLQQAEQSLATVPGGDGQTDDSGAEDTMTSMGVQSVAGALAATGGIGIGAMVANAMTRMAQKLQANGAQGTESPAGNAQIPLNSSKPNADRMAVSQKGSE